MPAFDEAEALRDFIREITLRFERGLDKIAAEIRAETQEHRKESKRYFEALWAKMAEQSAELHEVLEESRAQRQALLQILDRFDNGGAAAAG